MLSEYISLVVSPETSLVVSVAVSPSSTSSMYVDIMSYKAVGNGPTDLQTKTTGTSPQFKYLHTRLYLESFNTLALLRTWMQNYYWQPLDNILDLET